jgi:hypothetical protein
VEVDRTEEPLREQATKQLKKKRDLQAHLIAYVIVNAFVVAIWIATGHGFFWPIFPILGWGIGVIFHVWDIYRGEPTEDEISREISKMTRRHT